MTWQNAVFVIAGTGLMVLLEWARHRYDTRPSRGIAEGIMLYIGATLVILAGLIIVIFALKM